MLFLENIVQEKLCFFWHSVSAVSFQILLKHCSKLQKFEQKKKTRIWYLWSCLASLCPFRAGFGARVRALGPDTSVRQHLSTAQEFVRHNWNSFRLNLHSGKIRWPPKHTFFQLFLQLFAHISLEKFTKSPYIQAGNTFCVFYNFWRKKRKKTVFVAKKLIKRVLPWQSGLWIDQDMPQFGDFLAKKCAFLKKSRIFSSKDHQIDQQLSHNLRISMGETFSSHFSQL